MCRANKYEEPPKAVPEKEKQARALPPKGKYVSTRGGRGKRNQSGRRLEKKKRTFNDL